MTAYKRITGNIRDKGTRVEYDAKDLRGTNGAEIYTRAPQYFDHFVGAETLANTFTDTKVGTGTFAQLASGLGGVAEIATTAASGDANCEVLITDAVAAGTSTSVLIPSKNALERPISLEVRALVPTLTTVEVSFGLAATATQARTAIPYAISAASAVSVSAPDDGAAFVFSSVPTSGILFPASGNNLVGAVTSLATVDSLASTGVAMDANYHIYRIELDVNGAAYFYIDDVLKKFVNAACTASAAYVPFLACATRTTAARKLDIDYVLVSSGLASTLT